MKRDWNLVRKILLKLEEHFDNNAELEPDSFKGYAEQVVSDHMDLLGQAGIIHIERVDNIDGVYIIARGLTWEGYEFLEKIKNETLWNQIRAKVAAKGLSLSFDVIKTTATTIIKDLLLK